MTALSEVSEKRLGTCVFALQRIVRRVNRERMPLLVLCGHRGEKDQNDAFARGASKLRWPDSRHNSMPSQAVDLAPAPLDWNGRALFHELARHMRDVASEEGVELRWGGDWDRDGKAEEPGESDLPHYEVVP